ncbi:MAG: GH3 auxin-responsive promoter family protein [Pseudomonadota bacterium]
MADRSSFIAGGESLAQTQASYLTTLLERNSDSAFGQKHDFAGVADPVAYRDIPFMRYDEVAGFDSADYWSTPANYTKDRVSAWFLTSGSSSTPKRIPVTSSLVREKAGAFSLFWDAIYADHPALKTGKFIANFGDSGHSARDANNILEVSETTFWNQRMQGFQASDRWPIPRQITAIESPALRYYAAARLALQGELHGMMGLNPSTLLKFCEVLTNESDRLTSGLKTGNWGILELDTTELPEKLTSRLQSNASAADRLTAAASRGGKLQLPDLWPTLELIISWQSALVGPYLKLLREHSGGIAYRDYITQSSECIMAIPMSDNDCGGLLAYQTHFYEFIPEAQTEASHPSALCAHELTPGEQYELVVTTGGGLYRYRTADCMRVVGFENGIPHLSFQYRLGRTSSITGEKLTEAQVLDALASVAAGSPLIRQDVFVHPRTGERPHYALLTAGSNLKSGTQDADLALLADRFHSALCAANGEYADKCASLRLGKPSVVIVQDQDIQALHQKLRAAHVGDDQYKPGVLRREHDLDNGMTILRQAHANS